MNTVQQLLTDVAKLGVGQETFSLEKECDVIAGIGMTSLSQTLKLYFLAAAFNISTIAKQLNVYLYTR